MKSKNGSKRRKHQALSKQIRSSEKNNNPFYIKWTMKLIKMGLFDMLKSFLKIIPNFQKGRATKIIWKSKEAPKRSWPHGNSILILKSHKKKIKEPNYSMNKLWIAVWNLKMMFKCGLNKWISFRPLLKTSLSSELDLNRSFKIQNWCQIKVKSIFWLKMQFSKKSNKMLQKLGKYLNNWNKKLHQDSWKLQWEESTLRKDKEMCRELENYIQMHLQLR